MQPKLQLVFRVFSRVRAPDIADNSITTSKIVDTAVTVGKILTAAAAGGVVYENNQTISADYTMATNKNGMSVGPITISTGTTVTVSTGSTWGII